jgi:pimeloyl-[acyl-carrier protein] methyl ester esterase
LITPEIVLLPGMDGTGEMFEPLVEVIKKALPKSKIRIVRYPTNIPLGYAELVEFAAAQLPGSPCILIGESFSGPIALELAAKYPNQILRVVLSTSFVCNPLPSLAMLAPMLDFLPISYAPSWFMEQQLFNHYATPALKAALDRALKSVQPDVMRARLRAIFRVDARDVLSRLQQPILALYADADQIVPERCAREIKAAQPNAKIVTLTGPHCLLQTMPDPAWRVIEDWFDRKLAHQ